MLRSNELSYIMEPAVELGWKNDGMGADPSVFPRPFRVPEGVVTELTEVFPDADRADLRKGVKAWVLWTCYTCDPGFHDRVIESKRRDIKAGATLEANVSAYHEELDRVFPGVF